MSSRSLWRTVAENGIAVFDAPWKNVVATLYHEMNEFRTDPDVRDAIETGENHFLGWTSAQGREIGDQPIFEANPLSLVFQEVAASSRRLPVQLMYSNAVHGAEGPLRAALNAQRRSAAQLPRRSARYAPAARAVGRIAGCCTG